MSRLRSWDTRIYVCKQEQHFGKHVKEIDQPTKNWKHGNICLRIRQIQCLIALIRVWTESIRAINSYVKRVFSCSEGKNLG